MTRSTWREALRPLSFPTFRLLLAGRCADNLAHAIAPIALAFAVLDLGGTPSQLGLVLACRAVPTVVLVLLGGVIADRLPRHLVLVAANVVGATTQAMVAVLLLTGGAEIWTAWPRVRAPPKRSAAMSAPTGFQRPKIIAARAMKPMPAVIPSWNEPTDSRVR